MHYNMTISPDHVAAARQRLGTLHAATTRKWAQRLADERVLPDYATHDVIVECTPLLSAHQVIDQVTGQMPMPNRTKRKRTGQKPDSDPDNGR